MSKETIIPNIPPDISPEKLKDHINKKTEKRKLFEKRTSCNVFGESSKGEDFIKRLSKYSSTSNRWRIKGLEDLLKNFNK